MKSPVSDSGCRRSDYVTPSVMFLTLLLLFCCDYTGSGVNASTTSPPVVNTSSSSSSSEVVTSVHTSVSTITKDISTAAAGTADTGSSTEANSTPTSTTTTTNTINTTNTPQPDLTSDQSSSSAVITEYSSAFTSVFTSVSMESTDNTSSSTPIVSTSSSSSSSSTTTATTTTSTTTTPWNEEWRTIVGVVVGVGGFIILCTVIIAFFLIRYMRQHPDRPPQVAVPMQQVRIVDQAGGTLEIQKVEKTEPLPERLVPVEAFLQYVAEHQSKMVLYSDEFKKLPGTKEDYRSVALANEVLNRYINILPYDFNRVELQTDNPMENNFINASYIQGIASDKTYVATQGPMEKPANRANTYGSFWHMIWDLKCERIAMVTNLIEGHKVKCGQYWPKNVAEPLRCGKCSIRLLDEQVSHDYTVRKMSIHKEGHPDRYVKQLHFTNWPDQGVPETCTSLIKFHKLVFSPTSDAPVVVHCSAGVGRSGTLIALDLLLKMASTQGNVDVPKCVDGLRRQRMWMVQTLAQYIFLHQTLLEALLLNDVTIPISDQFKESCERLCHEDPATGKSKIQCQFEVLDVLKPMHSDSVCSIAKKEKNRNRNRSSTIVPADHCRFSLLPVEEDDNTYINAVYVDGYGENKKAAYVATQYPLVNTTSDFWRLVKDTKCVAVVMLNSIDPTNNNSEQYWPADGRTTMTGRFNISNVGPELNSDNVLTTNLKIVYEGKIKSGFRDSTVLTKQNSSDTDDDDDDDDDEDDETTGDDTRLTPNGVHLNTIEPVYANMALSTDNKPTLTVRHMHVLNWPNDSELPTDYSSLLTLYSEVVDCQRKSSGGRILVHCLYGAERTGLFIAMLNMLDELNAEQHVDVFNSVKRVRTAQPEFVPTLAQYKYLYELAQHHRKLVEPPVDYPLYANTVEL